jgi:hypothetical protein
VNRSSHLNSTLLGKRAMVLGGSGGGTIGRPKTEQLGQHTRRAKDRSELLQAVNVLILAGCARSQRRSPEWMRGFKHLSGVQRYCSNYIASWGSQAIPVDRIWCEVLFIRSVVALKSVLVLRKELNRHRRPAKGQYLKAPPADTASNSLSTEC